jgi:hypothetical protein
MHVAAVHQTTGVPLGRDGLPKLGSAFVSPPVALFDHPALLCACTCIVHMHVHTRVLHCCSSAPPLLPCLGLGWPRLPLTRGVEGN